MDVHRGTEEVRETWDGVSEAWDRHADELADFTAPVREALVAALELRPEDVVLELAAGTGSLSRSIAPLVREVRCTDLAPGMVTAAARRATEAGLSNVRCDVADAQDLTLPDGSVDAVVCQMGLMLMPDPQTALAGSRRVLTDGGRMAAATWGAPQDNLWIVMLGAALLQHGHTVAGDPMGPGGLFSLSTAAGLEDAFTSAGFRDVQVEPVAVQESFDTFEAYWDRHAATGGPLQRVIATLPPAEVEAVRETCRAACEGLRDGTGYRFEGQALVASAGT